MSETDRLHSLQQGSFGGVPCAQIWADFYLWECLLNTYRDVNAIIELGTWQGGFSRYLAAQAQVRNQVFATFDSMQPDRLVPGFTRMDIFAQADRIRALIGSLEPVALLVDNGNKPRELREFCPAIQDSRSFVVVHDWMTEVYPDDIPDGMTLAHEDLCVEIGSMSRVMRRES